MSTFDAFKRQDGGEPPDGAHTAWLERTSVFNSKAGDTFIRTSWRTTDLAHYWESLHGTTGGGKPFTQRLLAALGVNLDEAQSWEELDHQLTELTDQAYTVQVKRNGEFLNTEVTGPANHPPPDIPADTPEPASAAASDLFGDDDIPF